MGSKNRIAKHLLPIMVDAADKAGITTWAEPFVGGGNMIDKVTDRFKRIGYDFNEHAIYAMCDIRDRVEDLPESITEEYYKDIRGNSPEVFNSWLRFVASFGGKFDCGLARGKNTVGEYRNYVSESKRNALKQSPKIQGVEFIHSDYKDLDIVNSLIYCFNEHTEILTDRGWVNIKDITTDDKCLSREPDSRKLEYKKVVKTHKTKSQRMFYYKSKMLDFSITDDHNMFVNKKIGRIGNRKDMFIKPKDLDNYNFQFINAGGIWTGTTPDKIRVEGFEVDTLLFMYLLGIFFSDGSVNIQKSVTISQKKPEIVEKIRENLNNLGLPYSEYLDNRWGVTTFYLKKSWSTYFEQFYLKKDRKIPREIMDYGADALKKLLEGILDGDSDNERRRVYTGSITSVNDIQEILYKCGFASNYKIMKPKNSKLSCGRVIAGKEYYVVNILKTEYLDSSENNSYFKEEEKDVYCVTLEDWHTVLTRQNGKIVWMGQCDPPYQSATGYATGSFNHEEFFDWCRLMAAKGNLVFVSEYNAPDDFECVWQGEQKTNFSSNRKKATHNAVEKLFTLKDKYSSIKLGGGM